MIVTLLTDFGGADYFVAAMKGVILSRNPAIRIVDISHDVTPYDLRSAAFLLLSVYRSFPTGTVHVVVVDPGVGSERSPIVVQAGGYSFVGPDNGVFDMVLDGEGQFSARGIENPELMTPDVGRTFHGRDVFAPAAAELACGLPFESVGRPIQAIVRPGWLNTPVDREGRAEGSILHVDRFGNCVTSLRPELLEAGRRLRVGIRDRWVEETRSYYADGVGSAPFLIAGSAGFIEIAVNRGSAAAALGLQVGDRIVAEMSQLPGSKSLAFRAAD